MPDTQANIGNLDTLPDIIRRATFTRDADGVFRLEVDATSQGRFGAAILGEVVTAVLATYASSVAYDCKGYSRVSVVLADLSGSIGQVVTYKLQWSMDGIEWVDDWVAIAGVPVGVELPVSVYTPIIGHTYDGTTGILSNTGIMADVKARYLRVSAKNDVGLTVNYFYVQFMA